MNVKRLIAELLDSDLRKLNQQARKNNKALEAKLAGGDRFDDLTMLPISNQPTWNQELQSWTFEHEYNVREGRRVVFPRGRGDFRNEIAIAGARIKDNLYLVEFEKEWNEDE